MNPLSNLDKAQPKALTDEPIVVLNLLKFKSEKKVQRYMEYDARFFQTFGQRGSEVVYAGKLMEKVQGDAGDWDVVLLVGVGDQNCFVYCYQATGYARRIERFVGETGRPEVGGVDR